MTDDLTVPVGGTITITRVSGPHIIVHVTHAAAVKARICTRGQRIAFAQRLVDAATLDVWQSWACRKNRNLADDGFTVNFCLATTA